MALPNKEIENMLPTTNDLSTPDEMSLNINPNILSNGISPAYISDNNNEDKIHKMKLYQYLLCFLKTLNKQLELQQI